MGGGNELERVDTAYKISVAVGGTVISYLFGGWSALLEALLVFVIADYLTGMLASGIEGKLCSSVGVRGISKKVCIFVMVAVAHLADQAIGDSHIFRDATIFFYLANELLSVIENVGRIGLPVPDIIKKAVEILGNRGK